MARNKIPEHLEEARTFEEDRVSAAKRSERVAWRVAMVAGLISIVSVGAVAALTPLKTVELRTIRVDNSTGIVDVAPRVEDTASYPETVARLHLANYVRAHERYFYGIAEHDYEFVASQNTPQLNQKWSEDWALGNPQSPVNRFKDGTTVNVDVRSIVFLNLASGKTVAQVRYTKKTRPQGNGAEQLSHWVATIEYTYTEPSKDDKIRTMNPLGFRVVTFEREPEVVAAGDPS